MTDGPSYPPPGAPVPGSFPGSFPAPGSPPPDPPPPDFPPPYAPPNAAPHSGHLYNARPVYKPGTIPLRPLGLGDMYSGAIETERRNPKATIGVAAVVLTGFLAIPMLGAVIWAAVSGFASSTSLGSNSDPTSPGLPAAVFGGAALASLATIVLTGMIAHVVEHAARGQKLTATDAWALTRRRVLALIGLTLLSLVVPLLVWIPVVLVIVLASLVSTPVGITVGIVVGIAGLVTMIYFYLRLFRLAPASLVLEERGVFSAMGRSWRLTQGGVWRTFGITSLTILVTGFASQMLAIPFGVIAVAGVLIWPDTVVGVLVTTLAQNVSQVITGALITPFSAGVAALQYLDQRIRKEGYDIELIAQLPGGPQPR